MAKKRLLGAAAFVLMLAPVVALGPAMRVGAQDGGQGPILFDPTL